VVAKAPKEKYPFSMEKYAPYFAGLLTMIAFLLYRLNENSSTPKKNYRREQAEYRYCRTCNSRVLLDATLCLNCDDEP
jgi:hypothetical protein